MIVITRFILKNASLLKYYLAINGYSERSYARHINMNGSYLSQIICKTRHPGAPTARKIANGIGKTVPDIFLVKMRPKVQHGSD